MQFETDRLIMRLGQDSDFADYLALVSDPASMAWGALGSQRPQTEKRARETFAQLYLTLPAVAVTRKTDGRMIGVLNMDQDPWLKTWEIGYTFASAYWHQGYATEAAWGELQYLFDQKQASYVYANVTAGNRPSENVLARLGFTREGESRFGFLLHGRYRVQQRFGLTRAEYDAQVAAHFAPR
ncbi:GNAT family N-acetyltransferase [Lacticaseibacillus mingshuiensis]|uniref:GNAT family N-acetyltransferase n=1 Tax=Lacticaseibacillus mingshuiensis TaxID=2799574 RepID=UPI0019504E6F|nr:GNAT family N-acetyltransferase [Lacticaseibacillus mingshuiensis]